jgi:hypothetical protein
MDRPIRTQLRLEAELYEAVRDKVEKIRKLEG